MIERIPRPFAIGAFLTGAVLAGLLAGVVVTSVLGAFRPSAESAEASATAEPSATAVPSASETPEASASPSESASPSAAPSAAASQPTPNLAVDEGCFLEGAQMPEREPTKPIVAKELRDRLPYLGYFSEPGAWVGSSITDGLGVGYVNGFAACTDADLAQIRWGGVSVGATWGVIPMAAQIDGYTGPQLADVLIQGYLPAEQRRALGSASHDGWTYRYLDWGIGIAASADTVYWFQPFCCVDPGPDAKAPRFEKIIEDYLDLINDRPTDW